MADLTLCVGATGAQGGSLARSLLRAGRRVRALTRDPRSASARALHALGAEVVTGDLSDLSALSTAMQGCDSVFGVTNYWEHFGSEIVHGKNLVDAASQAQVGHLVLSTLPSPEALSQGSIAVPHMESKAAIEAYARRSRLCLTFVHVAFYYENFLSWFVPRPDRDGVLSFGFPQGAAKLAGVSVADVGPVVTQVLAQREHFAGATLGVVGDELPCDRYAEVLTQVLGRPVRYVHIERSEYAALPFLGASDLAAMFDLNRRFVPTRRDDLASTRALHPGAQSFVSWAEQHRAQLWEACCA
ncbi:MAG: hypothetical protein JWN48_1470 [Myxococcaceae bacterium]|nr:hypothetical protein [Myxococcaceae bacterium]